jgi:hypothetical protein
MGFVGRERELRQQERERELSSTEERGDRRVFFIIIIVKERLHWETLLTLFGIDLGLLLWMVFYDFF